MLQQITQFVMPYMGPITVGLCVVILLLLIYIIMVSKKLKGLEKKYNHFMEDESGKHLGEVLEAQMDKLKLLETEKNQIKYDLRALEEKQLRDIQKVHIHRYAAFENMGGDLSFVVTLLDAHNNGILLNGIHSREGNYMYAKPIEDGKTTYNLSDEEEMSLSKAINQ